MSEQSDCISAMQRMAIIAQPERSGGVASTTETAPQPYRFQPLAGTVWQDRFILNFYDNDPSAGILDWDCSQWTYDNHYATDILIRGFAEQDIGVPVFAALDGVVAYAHDGENDRNTTLEGQPANCVILQHQGTHQSWYWHLRKGSVAVAVGEEVKAGTQIGQVGSSGHSWMPHLHFESRFDGYAYEAYSGPCHPGPQHWVNQTSIPRHTWISEFAMHDSNSIPIAQFYPQNPPRTGTFVRTGAAQPIGAWYVIHNEPESSVWRARYLRPDGTTGFDSGTRTLNNESSRFAAHWFSFALAPDTNGAWTLELSVNGQVLMIAPFLVIDAGAIPVNRSPLRPAAIAFDPLAPTTNDAIFCRLTVPPLQDPDYDVVSYEYNWIIAGLCYRRVTNAALADAIPRGAALPGDAIRCVVTPYDGRQFGTPIEATIPGAIRPSLDIRNIADNRVVISWPTSAAGYVLQSASAAAWSNVTAKAFRSGTAMALTNEATGSARFFRLISP
ncbi:MAG TPA: M23 family metallopeptidase [Candidatus Binatia bacterium]|nr:M23 family metallopeptidase [Candidatus Binatia bacterium]